MTRTLSLALALAALPSLASAHTFFAEDAALAGRSVKIALVVPHGCDGRATTAVHLRLPEGFVDARPMPKPGWTLEVLEGDYGRSYDVHGQAVSSGPVEVRWTGGVLEDAWSDEFAVRGRFDASLAGNAAAFPATQVCGEDATLAWDEIAAPGADPHALAHPAPTISVALAPADGEHGEHGGPAGGGVVHAGALSVSGGFARAMLPNARTGGGYAEIRNDGPEADRLVGASSPLARTVVVHRMEMEGEVMRMRALPEGVAVPAGGTLSLGPGGEHLMFMDVSAPFRQGDRVPVTLRFEKAGDVQVTLAVGAPNASAAEGGGHVH